MKMWLVRLFSLLIIFSLIRNCPNGRVAVRSRAIPATADIVMSAIAQGVQADSALFYWHLGDFCAIYRIDQDCAQTHRKNLIGDCLTDAWNDFFRRLRGAARVEQVLDARLKHLEER